MAELKFSIGPLVGSRIATDENAQRFVEGFLRSYCERNNIDYDSITNQQRMSLYIKLLVDYTVEEAYRWYYSQDINEAVASVVTDPVIFE